MRWIGVGPPTTCEGPACAGPSLFSRSCSARYVSTHLPPVSQGLLKARSVPDTERLRLRPPRLEDADAFAAINADPEVTHFVSETGPLARGESDLLLRKMLD